MATALLTTPLPSFGSEQLEVIKLTHEGYGSSKHVWLSYLNDTIPSLILLFLMTQSMISYYLDDRSQKGLKLCHCSTGLVQIQAEHEKVVASSNTLSKNQFSERLIRIGKKKNHR